jgi:hypothetical protein
MILSISLLKSNSPKISASLLVWRGKRQRDRYMGGSGGDAAAGSPGSTGNCGAKRGRDPDDEVYLDNLHSSKRYLSEVFFLSFIFPFSQLVIS